MKFVKLSVLISAKGQQAIDNSNVVVVRSKAINHLHLAGRWS